MVDAGRPDFVSGGMLVKSLLGGMFRDVKETVNALCRDWTRNHVLVEDTIRVKFLICQDLDF